MNAVRCRQVVQFELRFGAFQRPGQVMDISLEKGSAGVGGVERIPIGKKLLQALLVRSLAQAAIAGAKFCRGLANRR